MANVTLQAIGQAVAGPAGGIAGGLLGSAIDRASRGRTGETPALNYQGSDYGRVIPQIFGRMRVAGNLIWAGEVVEHRPDNVSKSAPAAPEYLASFAIALSSRPVAEIGRMWADGSLLRDAAGKTALPLTYRLHGGADDQQPDAIISAMLGGNAPAFRGTSYVVFEDFPVGVFGNRVPRLEFEVVADATVPLALVLGSLLEETGCRDILDAAAIEVAGYEVGGASYLDELDRLQSALRLRRSLGNGDMVTLDERRLLPSEDGGAAVALAQPAMPDGLSGQLVVDYRDLDRDFQQTQLQRRSPFRADLAVALPAVLSRSGAADLAAQTAGRAAALASTGTLRTALLPGPAGPGDSVKLSGYAGNWRVESEAIEGFARTLTLARADSATGSRSDVQTILAAPNIVSDQGETAPVVLDIPALSWETDRQPRLLIGATARGPDWTRATIFVRIGDDTVLEAGTLRRPLVSGRLVETCGIGSSLVWDTINHVDVLLDRDETLLQRSKDAVLQGANLAQIGTELIQFASVEILGSRCFRLSDLLRGRYGTQVAVHVPGEPFLIVDPATLMRFPLPVAAVGRQISVLATGPMDSPDESKAVRLRYTGQGVAPWAPVIASVSQRTESLRISWARRSLDGLAWQDGPDPLAPPTSRFEVTVSGSEGARAWNTDQTVLDVQTADLASVAGSSRATVTISVREFLAPAGFGPAASTSVSLA